MTISGRVPVADYVAAKVLMAKYNEQALLDTTRWSSWR